MISYDMVGAGEGVAAVLTRYSNMFTFYMIS